ncbi:hypothetical protein [Pseudohoeflea coraliihabitans]|uniref:Fido domain-containing protein n=1 Tax=Pseudohoeflea coraliihabitans TaxID=2860393 RepID=A0ABS6WNL9_9HYPH|nr:hypothetical protein [Pseudohoeflea sp. DP4N28-3]MBW3097528.1 hypothetical protein [Pseudohoeflea sp. DP4N28-3]
MPKLPPMTKHRGFPSGLPGTGFQFTVRRANPKGATKIFQRPRMHDRTATEKLADTAFLHAIWHQFGAEPFERGNLDAGRISWLFGRELVPAENPFDPQSYEALLRIDESVARKTHPAAFQEVLEV